MAARNKRVTLTEDVTGEAGRGADGNPPGGLYNFSVNLKLFLKEHSFKRTHTAMCPGLWEALGAFCLLGRVGGVGGVFPLCCSECLRTYTES